MFKLQGQRVLGVQLFYAFLAQKSVLSFGLESLGLLSNLLLQLEHCVVLHARLSLLLLHQADSLVRHNPFLATHLRRVLQLLRLPCLL